MPVSCSAAQFAPEPLLPREGLVPGERPLPRGGSSHASFHRLRSAGVCPQQIHAPAGLHMSAHLKDDWEDKAPLRGVRRTFRAPPGFGPLRSVGYPPRIHNGRRQNLALSAELTSLYAYRLIGLSTLARAEYLESLLL